MAVNKEKIVEVKNLRVGFRSSKNKKKIIDIVRGVDFDIYKGEIVGFIGESGSGKSVTAKTLLGINVNSNTTAETMTLSGIDLLETKRDGQKKFTKNKHILKQIRGKKVAYIPQDSLTSLNPTKRIGAQIIEAFTLHSDLKTYEEKKEKSIELLEKFGIKNARERFNSYPHEFSGGMRQRVVIAMMVACQPDLIIADEPTTALDPTVQSSVLALFQNIVKEFGISMIFISHDIAVIAQLCNRINVFYAGRIVEKATKKELFSEPKHPYTWSLLAAIPDAKISKGQKLFSIPGQPPSFENLPVGDPFSPRNPFALVADFKQEPPLFKITDTHYAATWLIHPDSPKLEMPEQVKRILAELKKELKNV